MKFRALTTLLIAALGVAGANAQTVFVASENKTFGELNLVTGAYTLISTPASELGGLGYGVGGGLYGLALDGNLDSISNAGVETVIGQTGVDRSIGWGLGSGPDGVLYAQGNGILSTLNQTTGAGTVVGPTGLATGAVPVEDAAGNLYLNNSSNGKLYSINKTNGQSTLIGTMNAGGNIDAMVWDGGQMYAIDFVGDIYTVNTSTAALTLVSTYDTNKAGSIFAGASVYNAVPEPATWFTLAVGGLALLLRRKS